MRRNELEYILGTLLDFDKDVSDINFTVDKPPQVEVAGVLTPVQLNPNIDRRRKLDRNRHKNCYRHKEFSRPIN